MWTSSRPTLIAGRAGAGRTCAPCAARAPQVPRRCQRSKSSRAPDLRQARAPGRAPPGRRACAGRPPGACRRETSMAFLRWWLRRLFVAAGKHGADDVARRDQAGHRGIDDHRVYLVDDHQRRYLGQRRARRARHQSGRHDLARLDGGQHVTVSDRVHGNVLRARDERRIGAMPPSSRGEARTTAPSTRRPPRARRSPLARGGLWSGRTLPARDQLESATPPGAAARSDTVSFLPDTRRTRSVSTRKPPPVSMSAKPMTIAKVATLSAK